MTPHQMHGLPRKRNGLRYWRTMRRKIQPVLKSDRILASWLLAQPDGPKRTCHPISSLAKKTTKCHFQFIQEGGKTLRIFSSDQFNLMEDSFWDLPAEGLSTFKTYFTDNVFDTTILRNQEHCDLSLAEHMFPQLLSISGHIKYKPSILTDLHIPKRSYNVFKPIYSSTIDHNSLRSSLQCSDIYRFLFNVILFFTCSNKRLVMTRMIAIFVLKHGLCSTIPSPGGQNFPYFSSIVFQ